MQERNNFDKKHLHNIYTLYMHLGKVLIFFTWKFNFFPCQMLLIQIITYSTMITATRLFEVEHSISLKYSC